MHAARRDFVRRSYRPRSRSGPIFTPRRSPVRRESAFVSDFHRGNRWRAGVPSSASTAPPVVRAAGAPLEAAGRSVPAARRVGPSFDDCATRSAPFCAPAFSERASAFERTRRPCGRTTACESSAVVLGLTCDAPGVGTGRRARQRCAAAFFDAISWRFFGRFGLARDPEIAARPPRAPREAEALREPRPRRAASAVLSDRCANRVFQAAAAGRAPVPRGRAAALA